MVSVMLLSQASSLLSCKTRPTLFPFLSTVYQISCSPAHSRIMSTAGTTRSGASFATPPGLPLQTNATGTPPNKNITGSPPNVNVFPLLVANPPLPVPVVYTYNNIMDRNNKPWDLLTCADQARWMVTSSADSDHKRINISVNTALLLMDLFKDKAFFFG
jgi:hypothetical protein